MARSGEGKRGVPIKWTATGDALTGWFFVKYVRWTGSGAAADAVELQDSAGNTIFKANAPASEYNESQEIQDWIDGLNPTTLGSGELYVYVG